jgi:hypothetical protein
LRIEYVEIFKQDLISAFENRAPNVVSLEVVRLLGRFEDPELRRRLHPEFVEHANPERAWADASINEFEFNNQGSISYLLLVLGQEYEPFAFTPEQWKELGMIDDKWEAGGDGRVFTAAPLSENDGPTGMD